MAKASRDLSTPIADNTILSTCTSYRPFSHATGLIKHTTSKGVSLEKTGRKNQADR